MKITQHSKQIWTLEDFLSVKECNELISLSEKIGYVEAKVSFPQGAQMVKGLRNNYRLIYNNEDLAQKLWVKLKEFVPSFIEEYIALGLNEQFRFYKYLKNQRFKKHIDGRFIRNDQEQSRITFMVYLNENFDGGETRFDDILIKPKTGTALCFIHEIKHEGLSVSEGVKYVLRSDVMYMKYL